MISIIIPSFNHKIFIEELLESIKAQTYQEYEVIIVDDCSTDGSQDFLKLLQGNFDFQLILNDRNRGVSATLNRGIRASSGDYIVCIASDDAMPSYRLKEQLDIFNKYEEVEFVAGAVENIDMDGNTFGVELPRVLGRVVLSDVLNGNPIFAPTVMMRKTAFLKYGPYLEEIVIEDYYMWLRVLVSGGYIYNCNRVLAKYRRGSEDTFTKKLWYYSGAMQSLRLFDDNEAIRRKLLFMELKFSVLFGLKSEHSILKSKESDVMRIRLLFKALSFGIFILPKVFKNYVFKCIKSAK